MDETILKFMMQFELACGKGGLFELYARLLADKTDAMASLFDKKLEVIINCIIEHFKTHLTPEEEELISEARILRNKILHIDFESAANKVNAPSGGITTFTNIPKSGPELIEFILSAASGKIEGQNVRNSSAKEARIFAWLLECGANGTFVECENTLKKACLVINKLIQI
jgi:hypothetical protein